MANADRYVMTVGLIVLYGLFHTGYSTFEEAVVAYLLVIGYFAAMTHHEVRE